MKILDWLFNSNYYITIFASGFIGIFIYAIQAGDSFVDQNKFFYILTGLPVWFLLRYTYWRMRDSKENEFIKPYEIEENRQFTNSQDVTSDYSKEELEESLLLRAYYSSDSKVVNEMVKKILGKSEDEFDRKAWANRIVNRNFLTILDETNRLKAFEKFLNTATTYDDYYQIFEEFKWTPDTYIQTEMKVLRRFLWPAKPLKEKEKKTEAKVPIESYRNTIDNKVDLPSFQKNNLRSLSGPSSTQVPTIHKKSIIQGAVEESQAETLKSSLKEIEFDKQRLNSEIAAHYSWKIEEPSIFKVSPLTAIEKGIHKNCYDRGITSIFHFTPITNLKGIMKNGIISNVELQKNDRTYLKTDTNRNDGIYDGTCWSISHPNYYYLKKVIERFPNEKWCILEIGPDVLWSKRCVFNQTNAASKNQSRRTIDERSTAAAFESLFNPFIEGAGGSVFRRSLELPSFYPTDVQAEVIIRDKIEHELIKKIHVFDFETLKQVCNEIVTEDVQVLITKKLFHKRY